MDYEIIKGYDCDPRTTTTIVKGDTLSVNDQGHLLVECIREKEDGGRLIKAVFKDWECAYPVYISSSSTSISSNAKEPIQLDDIKLAY